jgi:hypothetical protein
MVEGVNPLPVNRASAQRRINKRSLPHAQDGDSLHFSCWHVCCGYTPLVAGSPSLLRAVTERQSEHRGRSQGTREFLISQALREAVGGDEKIKILLNELNVARSN